MSWPNRYSAFFATTFKNRRAKNSTCDGYAAPRPALRSLRTPSQTRSPESLSSDAATLTQAELARYSRLVANLKSSLRQAVMELDEAAAICTGFGLPGTGYIFKQAADRKRKDLERANV